MKNYFEIKLQGDIVSKKNSKRIAIKNRDKYPRPFVISSEAYLKWMKFAGQQLLLYKNDYNNWIIKHPLKYPIRISFYFIRKTARKWDWPNMIQGPLDLLVDMGFIEDDDAYHVIPICEGWHIDKNNPGLIIKIFR